MKFPEEYRIQRPPIYVSNPGDPFGCFQIPARYACGRGLNIIAADGSDTGWDHVSVSLNESNNRKRCPTWDEMCLVKSLFWDADEYVVQFHPPEKEYVNVHGGCLHLWKQVNAEFPTPPTICV